jgi:tetratricopeptide (TPR) repeat protein
VAAGGAGLWWTDRRKDEEFDSLIAEGRRKLDYRDADATAEFDQAVALRPNDPVALGLFAYVCALRTESVASVDNERGATSEIVQQAQDATRKALDLDPKEPNALLAKVVLERSTLDFEGTEDRLRDILSIAPDHVYTMRHLWDFLQCVGRCQDALTLTERAVSLNPLAAGSQFPRAQLLWIVGRTAEADRVIDRARIAWPDHRSVRFAQFILHAFTGRARAASDLLDQPMRFSPALEALWRINLVALDQPTPANIAAARKACLDGAKRRPTLSNSATMVMSTLGEIDAAFEILRLRYAIPEPSGDFSAERRGPTRGDSTAWRFAPWLFTPPVANVRNDPRFQYICDEIGLTDYWAKRRVTPDFRKT